MDKATLDGFVRNLMGARNWKDFRGEYEGEGPWYVKMLGLSVAQISRNGDEWDLKAFTSIGGYDGR